MYIKAGFFNVISAILMSLFLNISYASDAWQKAEPGAQKNEKWQMVSQATATWLWVDIYQASLFLPEYANAGKLFKQQLLNDSIAVKLRLCYQRDLTASQIITAAEKILPQNLTEQVSTEVERLHRSYRDVGSGDCYALEHFNNGITQLSLNSEPLFETEAKGFKQAYFGIWLGAESLSQDLKQSLLEVF
ncbi:chalcone isomerase family protein [Thiomicrorhabdus sediminis]|uniref:Chalcone isomerase domain-containing protein n=1 Tax=Thiomicrorhabdus sediminis TaxID=2580412 RepID=A0A4P9K4K9_9GAMM|nr:chalcone isomerase family protein [Thiomicrorhabdus sediminis]QCU89914.1 hypothetical protein FE785_04315 [Thiomicrorhabdus sediminis]